MTAEIAVANQTAVALAADSAATIGGRKIYNGAEKLFELSRTEPVGIMIYGNANLMGMPWETIIKEYRNESGAKSFPRVLDYKADFIRYIEKQRYFSISDQELHLSYTVKSIFNGIKEAVLRFTIEEMRRLGNVSSDKTMDILTTIIKQRYNYFSKQSRVKKYTKSFESSLRKKLISISKNAVSEIFQEWPISRSDQSKLYDIVVLLITRQDIDPENQSGIVFAGFGSSELYPAIHAATFCGMKTNRLLWKDGESVELNGGSASIIPFAQQEMVHTFMQGIDPDLQGRQIQYLERVFKEIPDLIDFGSSRISAKSQSSIRSKLARQLNKKFSDMNGKLNELRQWSNINPVLDMVSVLPKDELAAMAETLVSLTAFKRKVTHTLETVGGTIDVAVISKGDGLVWVKRKQYFPQELNAQ